MLWLFCSSFAVVLFRLWKGRHGMVITFKGIARDLSGKGMENLEGIAIEGSDGPKSPVEESERRPNVTTEKEE